MSKLCMRLYRRNSMLATKDIDGIASCPICEKPAQCHGKSIYYRALFWALSDDTGKSSKAIAKHMLGYPGDWSAPPSDADDRGRCIRLLELVPEWIEPLSEMVRYDAQPKEDGVVMNSSGVSAYDNSWSKQIPLILKEGGF